jgi:hypothetical protein
MLSPQRRAVVAWAVILALVAALHFVDHVVRGAIVVADDLNPTWNHSGWPFREEVNPFTFSLVGVTLTLLGGIFFTLRGKLGAGYWVGAGIFLAALVTVVHFISRPAETPSVIYNTYGGGWQPVAALLVGVGIYLGIGMTIANAIVLRRAEGHW